MSDFIKALFISTTVEDDPRDYDKLLFKPGRRLKVITFKAELVTADVQDGHLNPDGRALFYRDDEEHVDVENFWCLDTKVFNGLTSTGVQIFYRNDETRTRCLIPSFKDKTTDTDIYGAMLICRKPGGAYDSEANRILERSAGLCDFDSLEELQGIYLHMQLDWAKYANDSGGDIVRAWNDVLTRNDDYAPHIVTAPDEDYSGDADLALTALLEKQREAAK